MKKCRKFYKYTTLNVEDHIFKPDMQQRRLTDKQELNTYDMLFRMSPAFFVVKK